MRLITVMWKTNVTKRLFCSILSVANIVEVFFFFFLICLYREDYYYFHLTNVYLLLSFSFPCICVHLQLYIQTCESPLALFWSPTSAGEIKQQKVSFILKSICHNLTSFFWFFAFLLTGFQLSSVNAGINSSHGGRGLPASSHHIGNG